jgi:hypothetical protein
VYVVVDHHKVNLGPPPDMMELEPEPRFRLEPNGGLDTFLQFQLVW